MEKKERYDFFNENVEDYVDLDEDNSGVDEFEKVLLEESVLQ